MAQDNQVNKQVKTIAVIAGGAAVFGVAAIVVSVLSLIKAKPAVYNVATPTPPKCPAPATVYVSSSGRFASPDVFNICTNDTVTWQKDVSGGPDFQIHFKDGSPFPETDLYTNGHDTVAPSKGASAPSATYSYYKYQVYVKVNGQYVLTADPGGNVWR